MFRRSPSSSSKFLPVSSSVSQNTKILENRYICCSCMLNAERCIALNIEHCAVIWKRQYQTPTDIKFLRESSKTFMSTGLCRRFLLLHFVLVSSNQIITPRRAFTMSSGKHQLVLDAFGLRQFNNPAYVGTQVFFPETDFEDEVNKLFSNGAKLVDGYAPFW